MTEHSPTLQKKLAWPMKDGASAWRSETSIAMGGQRYAYRTSARIVSIITIATARLPTLRKLLVSHSGDGRPALHGATTITTAISISLFRAMQNSILIILRSQARVGFQRGFVNFAGSKSCAVHGACRGRAITCFTTMATARLQT